jgi:pentatricopeptide repeat protein
MFYNQSPNFREDPAKATIFITSCGRTNQPAKATAVLKQLIRNESVPLSIRSFNATMDAWASSTSIDAVEQCYAILRLIDENPRCRKEGIRPDRITYSTVLKCLSLSTIRQDAGERAQEILNMMKKAANEQQPEEEGGKPPLLPNELAWNFAIKSCYQCGDVARAEAILRDMANSNTPPTSRTYLGILNYFSSLGTMEGLQKAELVLEHMKKLGETEGRSFAPNKYSYNILICGWAKSNSSLSFDRVWGLYEEIVREKIEIDMAIYNTLINFYAKLDSDNMIERADRVLQDMEERDGIYPDFRHFVPVSA